MSKHLLIIGAGSVGKRHLRNFAELNCRVSIVDPRPTSLAEASQELRLESAFASLEEVWRAGKNFDGAVICSPPSFHASQALSCLERDLPLLIEKPLSTTSALARKLVETADASSVPVILGYTYRWWPPIWDFRQRLERGDIGRVLHVHCLMSAHLADWHPWERYQDFFMAKKDLGGGALLDESHFFDLTVWLFGLPSKVFAKVEKLSALEIDTDDNVDALLEYDSGLRVTIHLDLYGRPHEKYISAVGESGTLLWSFEPNVLRFGNTLHQAWETQTYTFQRNDMFVNLAKEFLDVLDGRAEIRCCLREGYNVLRIIDAMRLSSAKGIIVDTSEIP